MPKLNGLSLKQRKFIDFYLGDAHGNGTKAAQLAGYKGSPKALGAIASQNLAKPSIAREIQKCLRTVMTSGEVLGELSAIATAECAEPVRVGDKIRALDIMARHHGLYNERVDLTIEQINRQELLIILQSVLDAGALEVEPVIDVTPEPVSHSG